MFAKKSYEKGGVGALTDQNLSGGPPSQSALEILAAKVEQAAELGFLSAEWLDLARQAVVEATKAWESERAFRRRTGASDKWCRRHFEAYRVAGLARLDAGGRREWNVHARLSRRGARDEATLVSQIVGSYGELA